MGSGLKWLCPGAMQLPLGWKTWLLGDTDLQSNAPKHHAEERSRVVNNSGGYCTQEQDSCCRARAPAVTAVQVVPPKSSFQHRIPIADT